ncbi:unnamed protein product, partial [Didymodactylos carnosus]
EHWNEKLILNEIVLNEHKITQLAISKDVKLEELKSTWLNTKDLDKYSKYENDVTDMKDSYKKSATLFEMSKIYKDKKPSLKLYLKKSLDFLNKSIAIDEFIISSSSYDYDMDESSMDYFNKVKYDFNHFERLTSKEENIEFNENNFINLFNRAFLLNNDLSMNLYDEILKINPYFFEAQYQKLLKFYETNGCAKICHLHESCQIIRQSDKAIINLLEILIGEENYANFIQTKGEPGTRGGDDDLGGDAVLGGFVGHTGIIHIEEKQTVITDTSLE